ncbi:MAG: hypothetical protein COV36_03265 [Alphaproteobacteria bacterium CG11_big_fil_rev_8_21_14_0_20_44_7]|nr:MAG: hypothetical protein COV36_03265 [Alphaproteobacteria bacterium CG11_big_fil_rev_8_21_14_0_20_44_7]
MICAASLGIFLGSNALSEQIQMSMVYAAGAVRLVMILGLVIFTAFSIRRFFENREIDLMLVRPISRVKFIFAFWVGFSLIALAFVLFTSILFYFFTVPNLEGFVIWSLSLLLETIMVLALVMTASLILKSAVSAVMMTLGFYVLSRMSGFILMIVTKPGSNGFFDNAFLSFSSLIPRMDFFGKTEWLVYGVENQSEIGLFAMQAAIYIPLLLALAIIDFKKKEF